MHLRCDIDVIMRQRTMMVNNANRVTMIQSL